MRTVDRWYRIPAAQRIRGHLLPIATPYVEARTLADAVTETAKRLTAEPYEIELEPDAVTVYNKDGVLELYPYKATRVEI